MMKKVCAVLLIITLLFSNPTIIKAQEPPKEQELYAKSAVLMDADSGRVLYEKHAKDPMANASTTKILTCIVILENCDQNGVATASDYACSQPKVRLGMQKGQQFLVKDLLYGLMLESFNDCAVVLAEYAAGNVEGFADMMNHKAKEIGCENSYFITPNGLDAKDEKGFHHTTAEDLAKIMRYCITESPKADDFLTITQTMQHQFQDCENRVNYCCNNHNAFLTMMEGALSGKTGFTGNAGYCYVGALRQGDKTLIVALLACGWPNNKGYKWSDTKKLMQYGLDSFEKRSLADLEVVPDMLEKIEIVDGKADKLGESVFAELAIEKGDGEEEFLLKEEEQIEREINIEKELSAPVEKGTVIGTVTYHLGDEILRKDRIVVWKEVEKMDYAWCFLQVLKEAAFKNLEK